ISLNLFLCFYSFFFFLFFFCYLFFIFFFFFFNDTATTEIYTLSLHDALPISRAPCAWWSACRFFRRPAAQDRKSTRLNSSHQIISYAVFCLKKKKKIKTYNQIKKKNKKNKTINNNIKKN